MVDSQKFQAVLVHLYEGKEPIQFFTIFQNLVIFNVVLVLGIRNMSQKMALGMIHIRKTGLHFSRFKVQDQKICKQFKLTRATAELFLLLHTTRWRHNIYLGWEPKLVNGPQAC